MNRRQLAKGNILSILIEEYETRVKKLKDTTIVRLVNSEKVLLSLSDEETITRMISPQLIVDTAYLKELREDFRKL